MKSKHTFLVSYNEREAGILDQIKSLGRQGLLPDNRTEIFRRGLACMPILAEIDEAYFLRRVSNRTSNLKVEYHRPIGDPLISKTIEFAMREAKTSAQVAYAIIVAKHGNEQLADNFKNVLIELEALEQKVDDILKGKNAQTELKIDCQMIL